MPTRIDRTRIMVGPGDTTYTIARDMTGDGARACELVAANPFKVTSASGMFENLTPGETLFVPLSWPNAPPDPLFGKSPDAGAMVGTNQDAGALPYGWTDSDVQIVAELADAWRMDPEDLMAIWYSESGLQPHLERPNIGPGYYGLIMGWDAAVTATAGWSPGTWIKIVTTQPIAVQLQAIAQYYDALAKKMLGEPFAARAAKLGMTPAGVLYSMNYVPAIAAKMKTADQPMVRKGVCDRVANPNSEACYYKDNAAFDVTNKGYVSMRDMDLRISRKRSEALATKDLGPLLVAARKKDDQPFQGLAALFAPVAPAWKAVTGENSYVAVGYGPSSGAGGVGGIVLALGAAYLAWRLYSG